MTMQHKPVFRFAPSPNGYLHLGHALSALLNHDTAQATGGRFLLRIEDIDLPRSRPEFVAAIFEDLHWLGVHWEEPVRRQSQHFSEYAAALDQLKQRKLVYACMCSRSDIAHAVAEKERHTGQAWPRDPDGAPVYPGTCRHRAIGTAPAAWRLDMSRAQADMARPLSWREQMPGGGEQIITADPAAWGDVVLARKDCPTSYHLAVVHDDALQDITHVIRGEDLRAATAIHCVLQILYGWPAPVYHHHPLVRDDAGQKLSKSLKSTALRELRAQGVTPQQIRLRLGLAQRD